MLPHCLWEAAFESTASHKENSRELGCQQHAFMSRLLRRDSCGQGLGELINAPAMNREDT